MKIKQILHKIISLLLVLVALGLVFYCSWRTEHVFYDKDLPGKNQALWNPDQKFDVLIIGTSHASALQPCQMWERHGISAYNTYIDGDGMERALDTLKLSLQYCKPKLVLLETEGWWVEADFYEELGWYHHMFDTFPLTKEKIEIVNDFSDNIEIRKELLFPLYRYHSRWQELEPKDFEQRIDCTMGARIRLNVKSYEQYPLIDRSIVDTEKDPHYVVDIINTCKENDIPIAMVCLPYIQGDQVQARQNMMIELAKENGVEYRNLTYEEGLVDYSYDFSDEEHMNMSGGTKCCDYVCNFLLENYDIKDRRGDDSYTSAWDNNMLLFRNALDEMATGNESWIEVANLLGMDEYDGLIYIAHPEEEYSFSEEYYETMEEYPDEDSESPLVKEIQKAFMEKAPGPLGLLMTIKKNGEISKTIMDATLDEKPYLCAISRKNGDIVTAEYIGDEIDALGLDIPTDCKFYFQLRNVHDDRIVLDRAVE